MKFYNQKSPDDHHFKLRKYLANGTLLKSERDARAQPLVDQYPLATPIVEHMSANELQTITHNIVVISYR